MVPEPFALHCGGQASPLRITPGDGKTYKIVASSVPACGGLVQQALRCAQTELVPRSGGLLSNLSVLENLLLPALYHGRLSPGEAAGRIYRDFQTCGLDRADADAFCARAVTELGAFDRRLAALLRSLLMRPAVLLLERIFEGLSGDNMDRAAEFGAHYRSAVPGGTLVFFDLAGMYCPDVAPDLRLDAE